MKNLPLLFTILLFLSNTAATGTTYADLVAALAKLIYDTVYPSANLTSFMEKWLPKDAFVPEGALPPEAGFNIYQFLSYHNYTYENHTFTTEDGYILKAFRLPCPQHQQSCDMTGRPPLLMVHGIVCSPIDYILAGPKRSPGLVAVDGGYDVWLLANRGNSLYPTHTTYEAESFQFYNFSFHEIGMYDILTSIDYMTNVTGRMNVSFVGMSQASTALIVLATEKPEYNARINVAVLFAPVFSMANAKLPFVQLLIKYLPLVEAVYKVRLIKAIFPYSELLTRIGLTFCHNKSPLKNVCTVLVENILGINHELTPDMITLLVSNEPCGGSMKSFVHYAQNSRIEKFQKFNYGKEGNTIAYGSPEPPAYNLSLATAPIVVISAHNDYFSDPIDLKKFTVQLPNHIAHEIPHKQHTHVDFLIGKYIHKYVSIPTLAYLNKYNKPKKGQ